MLINGKKCKDFILYFLSTISTVICCTCLAIRTYDFFHDNLSFFEVFAIGFIMSQGKSDNLASNIDASCCNPNEIISLDTHKPTNTDTHTGETASDNYGTESTQSVELSQDITDYEIPHGSNEKTFKILESHFGDTGIKFENFYVNNKSGIELNVAEELAKKPDMSIKKDGSPQVLIYHTHTCESYMDKDQGFFYESFYPRTEDKRYSVVRVGNAICESLQKAGIGSIHDTTCHDFPSFNGSYKRSSQTIDRNLAEHPSIQVTIDIHRDTVGTNEHGKIKPTFKVGNRKAAQIMIMAGCDLDGSMAFPDWEYNLRFALRLQKTAEALYPGMTRAMFFGPVKYNMNKTHSSLLIEVGTDVNTLNEAVFTGSLLGNVLVKVFEGI